jgi:hypothetical protein
MKPVTLLILTIFLMACSQNEVAHEVAPFTKGVYGNPDALLQAGYRFDSLGINAVFVRSISLNPSFYNSAKDQGAKIYVEFPTLNGKGYIEQYPDAHPIDRLGLPSPPADWFMGVCPTHPGFKEHRSQQLREILQEYQVDGIFLDYVHWHAQFETPDPILPETCFCDRCTSLFGKEINSEIPGSNITQKADWILSNQDKAWRKWRADILNGWVVDMGEIVKAEQPKSKLGVFYCSWYPADYDSALYKNLGIDPFAFAQSADVLSPMLFHSMKDRPISWVGEYVAWLGEHLEKDEKTIRNDSLDLKEDIAKAPSPLIWPIVQAYNNPQVISPEDFNEVLRQGSKKPASGIMMFSAESIAQEPAKVEVLKTYYRTTNSKD